jgi:hypothetical protein
MMNLQSILSGFDNKAKVASQEPAPTTKVANATASAGQSSALSGAIADAMASVGQTKVAANGATQPKNDLLKIAEQTLGLDKEADIKHAEQMGSAFADGFVRRMTGYNEAAGNLEAVKQASEVASVTAEDLAFLKMARENPEQFLAEVERGRAAGTSEAEKRAADVYAETYNDTVRAIHKTASDHYQHAYAVADVVLRKINQAE